MLSRIAVCVVLCLCTITATAFDFKLPPLPDTSKKCLECDSVVAGLDLMFGNATSVANLIDKVNEKCGSHETCKKIVDGLIKIPAGIFEGMKNVAWPNWGMCAFIGDCSANCCNPLSGPEQVHLSLSGDDPTKMMVSWVTLTGSSSTVQYGLESHKLTETASGSVLTYTKAGWVGTIHRAAMTSLQPGAKYFYRVGDVDTNKWSDVFSFNTIPNTPNRPIVFAVLADMAYDTNSDNTVSSLIKLVDEGKVDVIVHSGDISYADGFMPHFDNFMNKVAPVASRVPYMVTPGNHEFGWNFAAYKARFYMPGSADSMYYGWQAGGVSFVALSSETEIDTANFNKDNVEFAQAALAKVDRSATPWVVAHFHRPLYCTGEKACDSEATKLRKQTEDIFYNNKVDFTLSGHVHAYQRSNPVYKEVVTPGATVHFMQGASGNREQNKGPYPPADQLPAWVANSNNAIGFGLLTVSADLKTVTWDFLDSATMAVLDHSEYSK